MRNFIYCCAASFCLFFCSAVPRSSTGEWISLFDGKSLDNWKVGENAGTFTIENGSIVAHGPTAHLFYKVSCV